MGRYHRHGEYSWMEPAKREFDVRWTHQNLSKANNWFPPQSLRVALMARHEQWGKPIVVRLLLVSTRSRDMLFFHGPACDPWRTKWARLP